jgi:hypothetical protein
VDPKIMYMESQSRQTPRQIADTARAKIATLERELAQARGNLQRIEGSCPHPWSEPERAQETYDREVIGPMIARGSDVDYERRYVPDTRTVWLRTCPRCGMTQKTSQTRPVATEVPVFS